MQKSISNLDIKQTFLHRNNVVNNFNVTREFRNISKGV